MSTLLEMSNALADVVEQAAQSIVRVEARRRLPATGFAWSNDLIVTAHHVLERKEGIVIGLPDGRTVEASLVGRDQSTDVAILRANHGLAPLPLADTPLRVGNLVLAVGRPGKHVQTSLGIVGAIGFNIMDEDAFPQMPPQEEREGRGERGRRGEMRRRWMENQRAMFAALSGMLKEGAVQTDVVMYPGFSGGALIDAGGFVRGMMTSGISADGSFTVSVKTIQRVAESISTHGKVRRGFLGVGAQPVQLQAAVAQQLQQDTGLLLVSVEAGSPAEQGGLYIGDVIVALDGQPTRYLDELLALLNGERVGKTVSVSVLRGGTVSTVNVTIGERE